jgi:hypothetical protein
MVDSGVEMSLELFVCIGVMEESTASIIKLDVNHLP